MLKFPKDLRKGCGRTHFLKRLLFVFYLSFLFSCAPKPTVVVPPQIPPVDPTSGLDLPSNPFFEKGYKEYQKGNLEKARSEYAKSLQQYPKYYPAWLAIAYTYLSEKNIDTAEKHIREALEQNPDYALAHFELAHIYELKQDYESALAEMSEVARLNPEFPALAQSQSMLKLKATEKHLEEGRRLSEENPADALRHLKAAHDLAPEIAQIPTEIASILLKQGNCREASPYLQIAIQKNPEDLSVKKQYAECMIQLQEYQQALLIYQDLALQQPDDQEIKKRTEELQRLMYINSLPADYQAIATTPEITRGQLSAYLFINIEYLNRFQTQDSRIIVDTIDHWAREYIQKAVNLGILDTFPNRTFQPNLPISKLELSKAASRVLEILEAGGKRVPHSPVELPDVPAGNVYYKMIEKSVSSNVVTLDADGRFHPHRRVTGAEAISVVNRLRSIVEAS